MGIILDYLIVARDCVVILQKIALGDDLYHKDLNRTFVKFGLDIKILSLPCLLLRKKNDKVLFFS